MVGNKSKKEDTLAIAEDLRLKIQDDKTKTSTLLMGCKTVCRYLGTLEENLWIEEELSGYAVAKYKNYTEQTRAIPNYRTVNCIYYNRFNAPLIFLNAKTEENLSSFKIPNAITELETVEDLIITGGPMLDVVNKLNEDSGNVIVKAIVTDNHIHAVLSGLRNRVYEFLDETIIELKYGAISETIFENIRKEVDSKMVDICPDAINKLQVAYENATSNNPEAWSHVGSSCRRLLKEVADAIFPPQTVLVDSDGRKHSVNESNYINRILAAIKQRSNSDTTFDFTKVAFDYIDKLAICRRKISNKVPLNIEH